MDKTSIDDCEAYDIRCEIYPASGKKKRYIGCCIQCQEILVVIVAAIWEENTTVIHQRKRSGSIIKFLNNINKGRRSNDCTGIL